MSELSQFRKEKDDFMHHSHQSPLTEQQKENFSGLNYFEENAALRLELEVETFEDQNEVTMQTSTGTVQTYIRYGRFKFDVEGEATELTLFSSGHGFFLPFVDSQAGVDTYGAGRYLDPPQLANGKFDIDFNVAYNPYCAYNELWSCPLPPSENRVPVAIMAGEKNFQD
jgi:uncharacterized protein (DUF1684 family)